MGSTTSVRVLILGQDPYPNPGEAHGLAFSVPAGVPKPPSLKNIHAELESDLGEPAPAHGNLEAWAKQGVLLLNTALTVRAGSKEDRMVHRRWRWEGQGWETFTGAVVDAINAKSERVVFILWGEDAKRKKEFIDLSCHAVIASAHPSPLSAYGGFLGGQPFSKANELLEEAGRGRIATSALVGGPHYLQGWGEAVLCQRSWEIAQRRPRLCPHTATS